MKIDDITGTIIDLSVKLHKDLGPGLLESVYESILEKELQVYGLFVERQKPISFIYMTASSFRTGSGWTCWWRRRWWWN
jgi:iron complex transport system substrate-binding protein